MVLLCVFVCMCFFFCGINNVTAVVFVGQSLCTLALESILRTVKHIELMFQAYFYGIYLQCSAV